MVAVKAAFVLSLVLIVPKGTLNTGSKMFESYLANTAIELVSLFMQFLIMKNFSEKVVVSYTTCLSLL